MHEPARSRSQDGSPAQARAHAGVDAGAVGEADDLRVSVRLRREQPAARPGLMAPMTARATRVRSSTARHSSRRTSPRRSAAIGGVLPERSDERSEDLRGRRAARRGRLSRNDRQQKGLTPHRRGMAVRRQIAEGRPCCYNLSTSTMAAVTSFMSAIVRSPMCAIRKVFSLMSP